jgi:YtkA-like
MIGPGSVRAIALAIACTACSAGSGAPPSFVAEAFITSTTNTGALRVEVRTSPQPPVRGEVDAQLVMTRMDDGTPVDGLTLRIQPWMPAMNHGAVPPTIEAQGNGTYLVTGLDLFMPGHWQLRTDVSGPVTDHVEPDFDIQ